VLDVVRVNESYHKAPVKIYKRKNLVKSMLLIKIIEILVLPANISHILIAGTVMYRYLIVY